MSTHCRSPRFACRSRRSRAGRRSRRCRRGRRRPSRATAAATTHRPFAVPMCNPGELIRAVKHAPGRISPWPERSSEKVWERHVVRHGEGEPDLLYIDLHLDPRGHVAPGVRRAPPGRTHRPPTRPHRRHDGPQRARPSDIDRPVADPISRKQMEVLASNCAEFGIRLYPMGEPGQGIVHVIGPELGLTQPGMTIVCGDSHTSTHGAFGALAFGIGTSEVEHVLATQTLPQAAPGHDGGHRRRRAAAWRHRQGHRARDHRPHRHRRRHRLDHRVPRLGDPRALDGRAHDRLQHVDRSGRACRAHRARRHHVRLPRGPRVRTVGRGLGAGRSTTGARSSPTTAPRSTRRSCSTPPRSGRRSRGAPTRRRRSSSTTSCRAPTRSPIPTRATAPSARCAYMGLKAGTPMREIAVDTVFIGSCTNSRIEDLRAAAAVGRRAAGARRRAHAGRARLDAA